MTPIYLMHAQPAFDPVLMRVLTQVNSLSLPFRDSTIVVKVCTGMVFQHSLLLSTPADELLAKCLTFTIPYRNTCSPKMRV